MGGKFKFRYCGVKWSIILGWISCSCGCTQTVAESNLIASIDQVSGETAGLKLAINGALEWWNQRKDGFASFQVVLPNAGWTRLIDSHAEASPFKMFTVLSLDGKSRWYARYEVGNPRQWTIEMPTAANCTITFRISVRLEDAKSYIWEVAFVYDGACPSVKE